MVESEDRDPMHVLVVDDDVHSIERIQEHLTRAGIRVSVTDVVENLESRIAIVGPDVVLLDVLMPGLSGKDLSRLLETYSMDGEPRVILLSPIPPITLRTLVDVSGAFAIVQVDQAGVYLDEVTVLANNGFFAPSESLRPNLRRSTLVSGTHRIGAGPVASDPRGLQQTGSGGKRT